MAGRKGRSGRRYRDARADPMTTGQVAQAAGVCPNTVRGWVRKGLLKARWGLAWNVPGWLFRRRDVADFFVSHGMPALRD